MTEAIKYLALGKRSYRVHPDTSLCMFEELNSAEEEECRLWVRKTPVVHNYRLKTVYHPAVQDEIIKMQEEKKDD